MRKIIFLILAVVCIALSSCVYSEYTLTMVIGEGREDIVTAVSSYSNIPDPDPVEGRVFAGWYLDPDFTEIYLPERIMEDTVLYAKWVDEGEKRYTATFRYTNGQSDDVIFYSGSVIEPKAPQKSGYCFEGWYLVGEDTPYDFSAEASGHLVLEARWIQASELSKVTVSFVTYNGEENLIQTIDKNSKPSAVVNPERAGYIFGGWYYEPTLETPFSFDEPIGESISVYAKWISDPTEYINGITQKLLPSTVRITVTRSNRSYFGMVTSSYSSLGSGVIYKEDSGYYYVLTNNHVVASEPEYQYTEYSLCDAYGNQYGASLVTADPNYDLGVLKFSKVRELTVAKLANEDAATGTASISIGNPQGLVNAVNYGEIMGYKPIEMDATDAVNIAFPVGFHTAPSNQGSSGGGLFNTFFELIGINFAVSKTNEGEFLMSYCVPIEKVLEFLNNNNIR